MGESISACFELADRTAAFNSSSLICNGLLIKCNALCSVPMSSFDESIQCKNGSITVLYVHYTLYIATSVTRAHDSFLLSVERFWGLHQTSAEYNS